MTDLERLEMRIEQLCEERQGFVEVDRYSLLSCELRTCKLEYNEKMSKVSESDWPYDLVESKGAYYRKKWIKTGGFGAVIR